MKRALAVLALAVFATLGLATSHVLAAQSDAVDPHHCHDSGSLPTIDSVLVTHAVDLHHHVHHVHHVHHALHAHQHSVLFATLADVIAPATDPCHDEAPTTTSDPEHHDGDHHDADHHDGDGQGAPAAPDPPHDHAATATTTTTAVEPHHDDHAATTTTTTTTVTTTTSTTTATDPHHDDHHDADHQDGTSDDVVAAPEAVDE